MTHRTTSATPVSHVFPGRRPTRPLTVQHPDGTIGPAFGPRKPHDGWEVLDNTFGRREAEAAVAPVRGAYKPATCPTLCRTHPDCVCAAYGALEGRQGVVDGLVRFASDLVVYLGKLEARLRALEVSGEGERG